MENRLKMWYTLEMISNQIPGKPIVGVSSLKRPEHLSYCVAVPLLYKRSGMNEKKARLPPQISKTIVIHDAPKRLYDDDSQLPALVELLEHLLAALQPAALEHFADRPAAVALHVQAAADKLDNFLLIARRTGGSLQC